MNIFVCVFTSSRGGAQKVKNKIDLPGDRWADLEGFGEALFSLILYLTRILLLNALRNN